MQSVSRSILILCLLGFFTVASAQLPLEIRADAYLLLAEQTIRDGDLDRTRTVIQNIRNLQEQHELDLPDEFHFRYAKAANVLDMPDQALKSILKYLVASGREDQHYVEALELMNKNVTVIISKYEDKAMDKTSATVQFNDLIIRWIPLLISILCLGVGIAIVYVFILNRKWSSLKDGFSVCLALLFFILIGVWGLVEAKISLQDWATALGAAALLAIIIIRYNPFNISDQESRKVNKTGDERSVEEDRQPRKFDALQELEFERRIMDRIQQRITGFTTMLALFGVFIGLFGYISLLNIEDTENIVNQLGAEAKQTLSSLNENIQTVMEEKTKDFSKNLDEILEKKIKEQEKKIAKTVTDNLTSQFGTELKIAGNERKENTKDIKTLQTKLDDYAMKTELKDMVTTQTLQTKLDDYAMKTELKNLVTTQTLQTKLDDYAMKTELKDMVTTQTLQTKLDDYAMKTELKNLVTTQTLQTKLDDYAMKTELKDMVTTQTLQTKLDDYQKKTDKSPNNEL